MFLLLLVKYVSDWEPDMRINFDFRAKMYMENGQ